MKRRVHLGWFYREPLKLRMGKQRKGGRWSWSCVPRRIFLLGYDGSARDSAGVSVFPVLDKAIIVR